MGRRPEVAAGFTLLELVVTLAVLAMAVAVVTPAIGRGTEGLRARAEVASFAATLRHAREQAITTQRTYRVAVDGDAHRVSISTLPSSTSFGAHATVGTPPGTSTQPRSTQPSAAQSRRPFGSQTTGASDPATVAPRVDVNETRTLSPRLTVEALQAAEVIFDDRGSSSGGDFKLTSGTVVYRVTVDRLTGRVKSARE